MNRLSTKSLQTLFAVLLLSLSGCGILTAQTPPTIPPPVIPVVTIPAAEGNPEIKIVENVVLPARDPDIVNMIDNISEQQMIAYVQQLQDFGTRNSFSETQREDFGIGATRRWIFSEFERVGKGNLQVEFQDFPLTYPEAPTVNERNVVATLPGAGNYAGVIVVGAHYDSRVNGETDGTSLSPSASDNGAGVAILLELARLMSARTWNQTIIFVSFSSEEQGTVGSRYFVNNYIFKNNRQVDLFLNNDSMGGYLGIPQSMRVFSPDLALSTHGQAARYVDYVNRLYQPDFPLTLLDRADRAGRYGDQREFRKNGIPALRFTQSIEDPSLVNSPRDTWDRLDYSYMSKELAVNLVTIANWAGAPPPPAAPAIAPMAEEGSYLVTWSPDPQAASYAISFRPLNTTTYPEFRYVSAADAGQTVVSGLDPLVTYGVSIAPISLSGRLGGFSQEIFVP